jgi:hypothetical protein
MMMDRLAQYWLLDLFLRILDQRLSIIGQMREPIIMGQPRQSRKRNSVDDNLEDKEQRGVGYIDEPRKESYLPDSVHGSRCYISGLAKNALVLILDYGGPHVFLKLTYNPDWPEIRSQ